MALDGWEREGDEGTQQQQQNEESLLSQRLLESRDEYDGDGDGDGDGRRPIWLAKYQDLYMAIGSIVFLTTTSAIPVWNKIIFSR